MTFNDKHMNCYAGRVVKQFSHVFKIGLVFALVVAFTNTSYANRVVVEHAIEPEHGQAYIDATVRAAQLFNEIQDAIFVETTVLSNYDESVIARTAGGVSPDTMTSNRLGELAGRGMVLPLDSLMERDGVEKMYVPASIENGRWGGELYQLPLFAQPAVTYYNEWLFQEAALENPNQLDIRGEWDWQGLLDVGRKIARDESGNGVLDTYAIGGAWHTLERLIFWIGQSGGYYFDAYSNPSKSEFNSPEVEEALRYLRALAHEHHITEVQGLTSLPLRKFINGEVGVLLDGPWRIAGLRSGGMSDDAWNIAPMLSGPAGKPMFVHVDGVQIAKASKNPEASWQWLKFLTSDPRASMIMLEGTNRPPALIETLLDYSELIMVDGSPKNARLFWDVLTSPAQVIPIIPLVPGLKEFISVHSQEIRSFLQGNQSVGATLETLDHKFNQLLETK